MSVDEDGSVETLYGLQRAELRRLLLARTGDAAEADDLLQELWLRVRQRPVGPVKSGRAYLFRMANNLVVDRLREKHRRMARDRRGARSWSEVGSRGEVYPPSE